MMKPTHRLVGLYAGAGVAYVAHETWWQVAASAAIASVTAAGRTSPDADQYKAWRLLDKLLPDELLGEGGPLQHRGISHFWGIPAIAALAVAVFAPGWAAWILWAGVVGWASHLAGDFLFGKASPYDHRGPGIPFGPWFWHHGVGLDTGGWLEHVVRWLLLVAPAGLAVRLLAA